MSLNATAPYLLTTQLEQSLRADAGCMVAIGCVGARRPYKNYLPYCCSKASLEALVRGLALLMAPHVRVNAVAPGIIDTGLSEGVDGTGAGLANVSERLHKRIALQRVGCGSDIAETVLFLARHSYITGQTIVVDGGLSLT